MDKRPSSPKITHLSWGHMKLGEGKSFKDAKLYPGGAREWNWAETGTEHSPGIQPADVQELLDHGARVVILSKGINAQLQVKPETLQMLKDRGIEYHNLPTRKGVRLYNELRHHEAVGGLFHSTC
jgi:hypothetical protein